MLFGSSNSCKCITAYSSSQKKLGKIATTDPGKWKDVKSGASSSKSSTKEDAHGRLLGANKLIGKNKRCVGDVGYACCAGDYLCTPATNTRIAPYAKNVKCKICKSALHQDGIYCQKCAYAKGMCAMYAAQPTQ